MINRKKKGFSLVEFLVASTLTIAVVASSTLSMGIAQRLQQEAYYDDLAYQIGNSIIQGSRSIGCGMATGDLSFDSRIFNGCEAKFIPGSDSEINTKSPIAPCTASSGTRSICLPATDGDRFFYTISSSLKLRIIYRTAWLSSSSLNSSNVDACNITSSQPDIFRRTLTILTIKNGVVTNARKIIDFQAVDAGSSIYSFKNHASIVVTLPGGVSKPSYYYIKDGSNNTIYRLPDSGNCAWFAFIPVSGSSNSVDIYSSNASSMQSISLSEDIATPIGSK